MRAKEIERLNGFMKVALDRFTIEEILDAIVKGTDDVYEADNKYNSIVDDFYAKSFEVVANRYESQGLSDSLMDYDNSLVITECDNIKEKMDIEQLIRDYKSNN